MEDKIFEMVIESMKQKLIFSDMVEMRKIIKGAVRMMEAHYEAKMPSDEEINNMVIKLEPFVDEKLGISGGDEVLQIVYSLGFRSGIKHLKSQLTKQT